MRLRPRKIRQGDFVQRRDPDARYAPLLVVSVDASGRMSLQPGRTNGRGEWGGLRTFTVAHVDGYRRCRTPDLSPMYARRVEELRGG